VFDPTWLRKDLAERRLRLTMHTTVLAQQDSSRASSALVEG